MTGELFLAWALLAALAWLFWRGARSLPRRVVSVVVLGAAAAALGLAGRGSQLERDANARARVRTAVPLPERDGFVSSDTCRSCHPNQFASWHRSYHRTMTQFADARSVKGKFAGVTLTSPLTDYHLSQEGDHFGVEIYEVPPGAGLGAQKTFALRGDIAMLTGSHRQQVYWVSTRQGNTQMALPYAFLLDDQRWVPNTAIFLRDPGLPPMEPVWNHMCIECHATGGQPRPVGNDESFATRVGELGIACEACHGSAVEHVRANQNPARRYALHLGGKPDPTIVNPAHLNSKASSQVCGQCHGIKWIPNSRDWKANGFRYRPGDDLDQTTPVIRAANPAAQPFIKDLLAQDPNYIHDRYWSDGMVRVSGREFNGMMESPCYKHGDLGCLSCHSQHQSEPAGQMAAARNGNEACLQCHAPLRANLAAHTHHAANSSGSECYNCHMPHTTYGLLKGIRSHQIDSPGVRKTQETGRPNACNLCHLDRSLGWTAAKLTEWYRQPAPVLTEEERTQSAAATMLLRGDAGQRALYAWSLGWAPARQASGEDWLAPYLGELLEDPYPAVRYIAARSLRRLNGFKDLDYDFMGTPGQFAATHQTVLARWRPAAPAKGTADRSPILLRPDGALDQAAFAQLLRRRDNHPMDLHE